ncbi:MAG: BatA domain-containing protein, partial [Terrimicrobiaceae bacterium]|nr:BatA domain-containing protein [Terrimicrobiaceae bacterium]
MIFLAPAAFWALALAIPITVLYLRREQARRLAVSNMVLWSGKARRLRESGGWQRLRHPLSLILQLAFLALLVLALARPLLPPLGGPLVLVLDRSASMGAVEAGSSRISQAAAALARFAHPGAGPFTLVATGTPPEILAAGSTEPEDIRRLLAAAQPAQSQLNPRPALDMARSIAGAQGGRVIFATDGVWSEETPTGGLEGVELVVVGAPGPVNAGLVALAASRSPGAPEEVVVLGGHGSSAAPPPAAVLRLSANGRLVEAREIAGGASSPVFRQWALRLPESAKLAASLDTRDALSAANSAESEVPAAE